MNDKPPRGRHYRTLTVDQAHRIGAFLIWFGVFTVVASVALMLLLATPGWIIAGSIFTVLGLFKIWGGRSMCCR